MTNDDEIDGLAAEYVLGSLDPIERKEVDVRRKVDVALDGAISAWEKRLGPLSDLLPAIAPPPHLFLEVTKQLGRQRDRQKIGTQALVRPWRWPALAAGACALAACLAIITVWLSPKSSASPARLVAELEKKRKPGRQDQSDSAARLCRVFRSAGQHDDCQSIGGSTRIKAGLPALAGSRRISATDLSWRHPTRGTEHVAMARNVCAQRSRACETRRQPGTSWWFPKGNTDRPNDVRRRARADDAVRRPRISLRSPWTP